MKNRFSLFNTVALIIFALLVFSIFDSFRWFMNAETQIKIIQGSSVPISGYLHSNLPALERLYNVKTPQDIAAHLSCESSSPHLSIQFQELSGRMWRGELFADPTIRPGIYLIAVHQKDVPLNDTDIRLQVLVFKNSRQLQASEKSFCQRQFGIQPFWFFLLFLPLGLFMLYLSYLRGVQAEKNNTLQTQGVIYKLALRQKMWEIVFGLGSQNGIKEGQTLFIINKKGEVVAEITAQNVGQDLSEARIDGTIKIRPSDHVTSKKPN